MKVIKGNVTIILQEPDYNYGYLDINDVCELAIEFSELKDFSDAFNKIEKLRIKEIKNGL